MAINIEDAKEIAKLCNLDFNEIELLNITKKINDILDEVKKLELLEECLDKYNQGTVNVFRKDEPIESLDLDDVFKNTENRRDDYFSVRNNNRKGC